MQGWDEGGIHWNDMGAPAMPVAADSLNAARIKYREFIRTYRDEQRGTFIYRCVRGGCRRPARGRRARSPRAPAAC
jgi:hypothetical protein